MNYFFPPQLGQQSDHVLSRSPVYTPAARLETAPWEHTLPPRSANKVKVKAKDEGVVYTSGTAAVASALLYRETSSHLESLRV